MAKQPMEGPKSKAIDPASRCTRQEEKGNWRVITNRTGKDCTDSYKSKE